MVGKGRSIFLSPQFTPCGYRKWLHGFLTVVIAFSINLMLFNLMSYLLHSTDKKSDMEQVVSQINVIRFKIPETPAKRTTKKPPESPPEKQPPKPPAIKRALKNLTLPFSINPRLPAGPGTLSLPDIPVNQLDTADLNDVFAMGELDSPLVVLVRIPPVYPLQAKRRGIKGWVKIRFIVNEDGHVGNVTVRESEPKDVFNASVIRSVSGWLFKAGTIGGIAVKTWIETTIHFTLD